MDSMPQLSTEVVDPRCPQHGDLPAGASLIAARTSVDGFAFRTVPPLRGAPV